MSKVKMEKPEFTTVRGRLCYTYLTGEPNEYKGNRSWSTELRFDTEDDNINASAVEDMYARMREVEKKLEAEYRKKYPKEKIVDIQSGLKDVEYDKNDNTLPPLLKVKTGVFEDSVGRGRPIFFDRVFGANGKARQLTLEEAKEKIYAGAYAIIKGVITVFRQDNGILYLTYRPRAVQFIAHGEPMGGMVQEMDIPEDEYSEEGNATFEV